MIKKFLMRKFKKNRFRKYNKFRNSMKFKRLYKFSQFRLTVKRSVRRKFPGGMLFQSPQFSRKNITVLPKLDSYRAEIKTPLQTELLTFAQEYKLFKILGHMDAPYC